MIQTCSLVCSLVRGSIDRSIDAASSRRRICCECVGRCCWPRPHSPGTGLPSPWTDSFSSCPAPPESSTPPRLLSPPWSCPSCPRPARSPGQSLSRGRARPGAAGPGDRLSSRVPGGGTETAACCSDWSSSERWVTRDGARMWAWLLCVIQIMFVSTDSKVINIINHQSLTD